MAKLTNKASETLKEKMRDKSLPLAVRQKAYKDIMDSVLNPKTSFNKDTFDPFDDDEDYEVKKRTRKAPSPRLPTMGMLPKEILEGQMVGMYESKQDLYLLIAWLSHRVSDLEDEVKTLKGG